jgi:hypothetical protein
VLVHKNKAPTLQKYIGGDQEISDLQAKPIWDIGQKKKTAQSTAALILVLEI